MLGFGAIAVLVSTLEFEFHWQGNNEFLRRNKGFLGKGEYLRFHLGFVLPSEDVWSDLTVQKRSSLPSTSMSSKIEYEFDFDGNHLSDCTTTEWACGGSNRPILLTDVYVL